MDGGSRKSRIILDKVRGPGEVCACVCARVVCVVDDVPRELKCSLDRPWQASLATVLYCTVLYLPTGLYVAQGMHSSTVTSGPQYTSATVTSERLESSRDMQPRE